MSCSPGPTDVRISLASSPASRVAHQSVLGIENAACSLGGKVRLLPARDPAEITNAFATLKKDNVKTLMVLQDPMFLTQQKLIVNLAAKA